MIKKLRLREDYGNENFSAYNLETIIKADYKKLCNDIEFMVQELIDELGYVNIIDNYYADATSFKTGTGFVELKLVNSEYNRGLKTEFTFKAMPDYSNDTVLQCSIVHTDSFPYVNEIKVKAQSMKEVRNFIKACLNDLANS